MKNLVKRSCSRGSSVLSKERMDKASISPPGRKGIYDNQSLMKLLNVSGAYLRKLRDNGYLGFSRHGDKYWYTQEDVDRFIRRFHYEAFAISDVLPEQKESIHG